ncbi:hypothetical protein [uncultured Acinetobacter sp.]|nr:hypothetical protein [uncultured Acinetobacter sp.]
MELIKNTENGEYGIEGEVFFGLFEKYIMGRVKLEVRHKPPN